eukprot:3815614-Prymnesium_polylepis.1
MPVARHHLRIAAFASLISLWKDADSCIWEWAIGNMNKKWQDANASMKLLLDQGWIHHLRRHLVADVLCRGELNQHFLYGEAWFRQTEVDHDAALNRANWMWLAAVAFSTKQYYAHYNPINYIQKGSQPICHKLKCARKATQLMNRVPTRRLPGSPCAAAGWSTVAGGACSLSRR